MNAHLCHIPDCATDVPPRMFACRRHWAMVPPWLQGQLYAIYKPGQERTKRASRAYMLVQLRCQLAVVRAEGQPDAAAVVSLRLCRMLRILRKDLDDDDDAMLVRAFDRALNAPRTP